MPELLSPSLVAALLQSPIATAILASDGALLHANPAFFNLTGFEAPAWGQPIPALWLHPQGLASALAQPGEPIRSVLNVNGSQFQHCLTAIEIAGCLVGVAASWQATFETEERFQQIVEMTGDWWWELDAQGHYLASGCGVEAILGVSAERIIGHHYGEYLATDLPACAGDFRRFLDSGQGFCRVQNAYRHRDGHSVFSETTAYPQLNSAGQLLRWRGVDHNNTARRRFEETLRQRTSAIEAAHIGVCIINAGEQDFLVSYANPAYFQMTGLNPADVINHSLSLRLGDKQSAIPVEGIFDLLLATGHNLITQKCYRKSGEWFWCDLSLAPVRGEQGQLTHFVLMMSDVSDRHRAEEERNELNAAREIQRTLLPSLPLITPHLKLFGGCTPAKQVGGDYFDYFLNPDTVDVVIADVSGHSMGSALMMSEARITLKAEAKRQREISGLGSAAILRSLNDLLYEDLDGSNLFISLFHLRYQPATGKLIFANAGHNPPLLLKSDQANCLALDAEGLVLGVLEDVLFEEKCLEVRGGDRLLLYTDGLVEARDEVGNFYGMERLTRWFESNRNQPIETLVQLLLEDLKSFRGQGEIEDDVTLLIIELTAEG